MPRYGPGFWVHFIYGYGLTAVATFLLARAVYRSSGVFRTQSSIMLFGVMLPWVVNIIDMSRVFGFIHVDTCSDCLRGDGAGVPAGADPLPAAGADARGVGGGGAGDG